MNLNDYFDPVSIKKPDNYNLITETAFGRNIKIHTPNKPIREITNFDICLVGIPEDRNAVIKGSATAPDLIRNMLYQLQQPNFKTNIIDLGNFKVGNTISDTYAGVRDLLFELIKNNILPIIIGGSHDLTYPLAMAYEKFKARYNLITIDSKIDLEDFSEAINSRTYLKKLFEEKKYLFNYACLGYQSYFINKEQINYFDQSLYDLIRLGIIQSELKESEPIIRDADAVTIDVSSIRQADAPGQADPSPNGLYGEEICQIAKYSGLSDKLSLFGIFELFPKSDNNNQTAHLIAQSIWYFIQGYYERKKDFPVVDIKNHTKYIVNLEKLKHELIFYKSQVSQRWWMEIPEIKKNKKNKFYISCSYNDYLKSCEGEIPDRWWKTFQKIN